jgi:hypothetical protein
VAPTGRALPILFNDSLTLLPLPTKEDWKIAISQDTDLAIIIKAKYDLRDPTSDELTDKSYHKDWHTRQLEVDEGIQYR